MQFALDWFAKGIVQGALEGVRVVHIEEQVTPEVLSLDAWIDPLDGVPDADRGLLGFMTRARCVVEPYQPAASLDDVDLAALRVTLLHQKLKAQVPAATEGRRRMPPRPVLWIVSASRDGGVLREWLCVRDGDLGRGVYRSRVATRGPRVVVVDELPRTRATLLVRMMGHGEALQRALDDLRALPTDAWERAVVAPLLRLIRRDLERRGIVVPDLEAPPVIIDYKILLAEAEVEKQRYLDEGRRLGRAEGLRPILHLLERRLARPLTDAEHTRLAARFDLVGPERLGDVVFDLTPDALAAWLADPNAR
ncbi:MAG: hypothetical protein U0324_43660 [Polyangiales bacterium]